MPLTEMDPLLVLRGIIHAWRERVSFDHMATDVPVPMRLLCMCADEIARSRDMLSHHGPAAVTDQAAEAQAPDGIGGSGSSDACDAGCAAEDDRGTPPSQCFVHLPRDRKQEAPSERCVASASSSAASPSRRGRSVSSGERGDGRS